MLNTSDHYRIIAKPNLMIYGLLVIVIGPEPQSPSEPLEFPMVSRGVETEM
jgi:hypothetical protein